MPFKSLLTGALLALSLTTSAQAEIEIHDPYARSSNAMAGAAFVVITNTGDTDDRLLEVRSDAAARTQLHTHVQSDDGVMRMVHVEDGFVLPAGGEILMQRGGAHIMFMGLTDPFEQDAMITVTLVFEIAGEVTIDIPVDQTRQDAPMDHGEMDHETMDHGSDS